MTFFSRIGGKLTRASSVPPSERKLRRASVPLRSMPPWLALSPWIVVAGSLLLALMVLLMDSSNRDRESEIATRIFSSGEHR